MAKSQVKSFLEVPYRPSLLPPSLRPSLLPPSVHPFLLTYLYIKLNRIQNGGPNDHNQNQLYFPVSLEGGEEA